MAIVVICRNCGVRFNVDDQFAGRRGTCKKCGATVVVPAANGEGEQAALSSLAEAARSIPATAVNPARINAPSRGMPIAFVAGVAVMLPIVGIMAYLLLRFPSRPAKSVQSVAAAPTVAETPAPAADGPATSEAKPAATTTPPAANTASPVRRPVAAPTVTIGRDGQPEWPKNLENFLMASRGQANALKLLDTAPALVNARKAYDPEQMPKAVDGQTPLHRAAITAKLDFAQELLKRGANVDVRDRQGLTPLHHAVRRGGADLVKLLVEH